MTSVKLTWLGHAAFLLESEGQRLMLDPYNAQDAGSYDPIDIPADIVLVSHLNPKYHSHWAAALGSPLRLNALDFAGDPDGVETNGINFRAVPVFESPDRTVPVAMPYFTLGGVSFCHSGDLGNALTEEEAAPIVRIDVFLAVAGGPPTVPMRDLKAAIDLIQPRIVIPMHYQTGKVNLDLLTIDSFLALFPSNQISYHSTPTLDLSPKTLPSETQVIVLPSAR